MQRVIAVCMFSMPGCAAPAFSQIVVQQNGFITFEVPNAQGTVPGSINNALTVTGYDYSPEPKGFVRDAAGNVTSFAPAGCLRTSPTGINDVGAIVGICTPPWGFLRDPLGAITFLNCPGLTYPDNTWPFSINVFGAI